MDFSIIIPAKNEANNIGRCLDSIHAMDFDPNRFEVLVIDNGSADRTVDIARSQGAKVFEMPGLTISALRNFGANQATGAVLAFLDADCTVAPNWLGEAGRYLASEEIACFGGPPGIPADATWVQKAWLRVREKKIQVQEVEWLESMNMFIPRKVFSTVGGFDESLVTCEDYDLSLRLKAFGTIIADRRITAVHHGEAATLGHFFRKERWRATSNAERLKRFQFGLQELPSLIVPPAYCLLALLVLGYSLVTLLGAGEQTPGLLALVVVWQVPLAFLAIWKTRNAWDARIAGQLFVLLNVYFCARGLAVFRWS